MEIDNCIYNDLDDTELKRLLERTNSILVDLLNMNCIGTASYFIIQRNNLKKELVRRQINKKKTEKK